MREFEFLVKQAVDHNYNLERMSRREGGVPSFNPAEVILEATVEMTSDEIRGLSGRKVRITILEK